MTAHLVVRLISAAAAPAAARPTPAPPGAAVLEHVGVVVGGEQGVHRHRHHAGVHGAEKATGQSLQSCISSSTRSSRWRPRAQPAQAAHALGSSP
jgi:hypothetical protein